MKRKASQARAEEHESESAGEEGEKHTSLKGNKERKKRKTEKEPKTLHARILKQLKRLGCKTIKTKAIEKRSTPSIEIHTTSTTTSTTTTTTTASTSTISITSTTEPVLMGGRELPEPLQQWMTGIEWPKGVMKNEERDLMNIELRGGWELKGDLACEERPCLEIGSAYEARSNAALFLAIPLDCEDPSMPEVIIKHIDGSDGPLLLDDEGIPLIEFLAELESDSYQLGDVVEGRSRATTGGDYSRFLQALSTGENLPSDDDDGEHEDEDDDAGEEAYEWKEKLEKEEDDDEEDSEEDEEYEEEEEEEEEEDDEDDEEEEDDNGEED